MRLGYCACAAEVNASHPKRNRNTARATEFVPLRILAPWRNQYAMLRAGFAGRGYCAIAFLLIGTMRLFAQGGERE
jgi:hypothetical protein